MREIKFRAWDEDDKCWEYLDIQKVLDAISLGDTSSLPIGDCLLKNLSQYTGLHDKNGKEIYEGDILRDDQKDIFEVRFGELPLDKSGDCVCTYPAFYAHYEKTVNGRTGFGHECNIIGDWMEIIGNIYQNPELLEIKSK